MKVGDKIILNIEKVIWEGKGLGHCNGQVVMVDYVLPGEKVKVRIDEVKRDYAIGSLLDVIETSKERILPRCRHFYQCGGCSFQHTSYDYQIKLKRDASIEAMSRILGRDVKYDRVIKSANPWYYRNKAQFPIERVGDRVIGGFYQKTTHKIIDLQECPLHPSIFIDILQWVKTKVKEEDIKLRYLYLRGAQSGDIMVTFVTWNRVKNVKKIALELEKAFPEVVSVYENINKRQSNVVLGDKFYLIDGSTKLEQKIRDYSLLISPGSFFQINIPQVELIVDFILSAIFPHKGGVFIDGYAGVGTFTIPLSKISRYGYSIEENPTAVEDALGNIKLNKVSNIRVRKGKTEIEARRILEDEDVNYILVDPPRKGIEENLALFLSKSSLDIIVYVSCNPTTLARDIKILESGNFYLKELRGFDLFPQTAHIEYVAVLTRRSV
jgi:23S rRNA (uracil1939-C5)-methyltransferase